MGKARSYEIIEYRKKIMTEICQSKELVKLLGFENEEYPEDVIPYNRIFPHEFIPEAIDETNKYINFDIKARLDTRNPVFKELTIYFFVVCHQKVVRYKDKGREYLWYDKVVCELDNLFSEQNKLGIGKMMLIDNVPYYPQQKFKGRMLTFTVTDFNNGLKYGK